MSSLQLALEKSKSERGLEESIHSRRNMNRSAPTVTTANDEESSSSCSSSSYYSSEDESSSAVTNEEKQEEESEDMIKIRQQAVHLLNTPSSGPNAEAEAAAAEVAKRRNSGYFQKFVSPYDQPPEGARLSIRSGSSSRSTLPASSSHSSSYQSSNPYAMHDPNAHPPARTAEELTLKDMVVNCVSEVCRSTSSDLIHSVLRAGYKSVSNYEDPPVNGDWGDSIDTSQHGYGNKNQAVRPSNAVGGNMPTRYQD